MKDETHLPRNWVMTTVGEIYSIIGGGTPSTKVSEYWGGDIPWITSADISEDGGITPRKKVTKEGVTNSATNIVPEKSIIVVTRVGLGKLAVTEYPICFSQDSQALIPNNDYIYSRYTFYYLSQVVQIFKYSGRGTTISGVTKKQLSELPFKLPPLAEQKRIVTKIEELFTKLDAGIEDLKGVKNKIDVYRKSVFKAAFEGNLVNIDSKWIKGSLDDACIKITDGSHYTPKYLTNGYPFISIKNRKNNKLDFESCNLISNEDYEKLKRNDCNPLMGDVLFSKDGTVGEVIKIDYKRDFIVLSSWAILRPKKEVSQDYLFYLMKSPSVLYEATKLKTGTAIRRIILRNLKQVNFNYPINISEQEKIVQEIESRFSIIDKLEETVNITLIKQEQLRKSILKYAFEGKLVPQDPTDEPAEVLLKRIQKENGKYEQMRLI